MPLRNKRVTIIGLTGLAGHGKTEVANKLVELTGFTRMAFGDAVKRACSAMYVLPIEYFYEGDHKVDRNNTVVNPYGITIRQMMRRVGDAMKSSEGGDFWIKLIEAQLELCKDDSPGYVIEDIRYDDTNPWGTLGDESSAVRNWGGIVLHVDAMSRVGRNELHNTHCSEKGVKRLEEDVIIDNNGSQLALDAIIQEFVETHIHPL